MYHWHSKPITWNFWFWEKPRYFQGSFSFCRLHWHLLPMIPNDFLLTYTFKCVYLNNCTALFTNSISCHNIKRRHFLPEVQGQAIYSEWRAMAICSKLSHSALCQWVLTEWTGICIHVSHCNVNHYVKLCRSWVGINWIFCHIVSQYSVGILYMYYTPAYVVSLQFAFLLISISTALLSVEILSVGTHSLSLF